MLFNLWHQRLGHVSERLNEMVRKEMASGITVPKTTRLSFCEGCIEGKMQRKPFTSVGEIRSTRKLQSVQCMWANEQIQLEDVGTL